jgi:SNF2 family DNA or RNA helicase
MPAKLTKDGEVLKLDLAGCRGSEFSDALAKVKEIPGRRWNPDNKKWELPAEPGLAERVIHSIQPVVDDELRQWVKVGRISEQQALTTPVPDDAELLVPWSTQRVPHQPEVIRVGEEELPFSGLLPHQRPVVDIAADRRKLIIADDMGLGKTGAMITAVEEYALREEQAGRPRPEGPKLVICPSSVQGSWARELKMWLGDDVPYQIVRGSTPKARQAQLEDIVSDNGWAIVNWEQIRAAKVTKTIKRRNGSVSRKKVEEPKQPLFADTPWLAVMADEVHRAKNRKAQVTRGLFRIKGDLMLGASGTPIMNSPDELWAILHWLWPKEYTSYWRFYEDYVEYTEGYFGKTITGVKNPDALRFELSNRLVRRTQGQVLDLPGKVRIPVPVTLNPKQRKLYDEAEKQMWLDIEQAIKGGDKSAEQFVQEAADGASGSRLLRLPNGAARTVRLRQIMETPACLGGEDDSALLDTAVDKVMDSDPDEQWVVFCEFVPTTGALCERLRKKGVECVEYTGEVDPAERAEIERKFQAGEIRVIVGTIASMYQGITLTAASKELFLSRSWVPAKNEQAEDRCSRIGQTERVLVYILLPDGTVATSKVEPLNRIKEGIVRTVVASDTIDEK